MTERTPMPLELVAAEDLFVYSDFKSIEDARAAQYETLRNLQQAGMLSQPDPRVGMSRSVVHARHGTVPVWIFTAGDEPARATFLHIHGGAFLFGELLEERGWCERMALAGFLVVSVDYRLAPEFPYPAAFEDVTAVLHEVPSIARDHAVLSDRVVVGGLSAGACLSAALSIRARDEGIPIALQVLNQPCLDDRLASPGVVENEAGRRALAWMWRHYLGDRNADQFAAPARATDLAGVAPALVVVTEYDALVDEGIEYAERLRQAGVPAVLHHVPGAFHAFELRAPRSPYAKQLVTTMVDAAVNAIGHSREQTA